MKRKGSKPVEVESNRSDDEGCDHQAVQDEGVVANSMGEEEAGEEKHEGEEHLRENHAGDRAVLLRSRH